MISRMEAGQIKYGWHHKQFCWNVTSAELASTVNTSPAERFLQRVVVLESLEPKGIEFSLCRLSSWWHNVVILSKLSMP